jgi:hypothetical integral membrane protein (TIGR02206 family)
MNGLFGKEFDGAPFELFGPAHLAALALLAVLALMLYLFRSRFGARARQIFSWGLAGILLVDEALWHLWNWTTGQWSLQETLPFHLCSVFVFLSAYMLITKSYRIYEFAYFLGIAGATQAILTPDAGIYGFPHFRFFQVFISHVSIVLAALYMTFVEGYRPTLSSLWRVIVGANIYMLVVGGVNVLLGSNYLYIMHKPATPSLLDVLGPWPWYILAMELLGFAIAFLLYLPFVRKPSLKEARPVS